MRLRGGSSKGLYFTADDLPPSSPNRDEIILAAMGDSERRQIDGFAGADPLTSKAAIVSRSERDDADLDYLFLQVVVGEERIDTTPNCGNILAGVLPFAIESGLFPASEGKTSAVVHMANSGSLCEVVAETPDSRITYEGSARIDGVAGTSAPIFCNYLNTMGSTTGALLPTGSAKDTCCGVEVTCVDNGMPVAVVRADDFGISGYETKEQLDDNAELKARLEEIRLEIGPKMNLGDVGDLVVPKMCLVSKPARHGCINTRTFIPHVCHAAIGVLGAVSIATACIIEGSVAGGIAIVPQGNVKQMSVEHPGGEFSVRLETSVQNGELVVHRSGLLRTAHLLSRGEVFAKV